MPPRPAVPGALVALGTAVTLLFPTALNAEDVPVFAAPSGIGPEQSAALNEEDGPTVVEAVLSEYKVSLNTASVPLGPVRVHVANAGLHQHDLRIESLGPDAVTPYLGSGDTATLEATFHAPGKYVLFCDVGYHAGNGMVTLLEVTP